MRTTINLPKDDKCEICENKDNCPEDIYDCLILNDMINTKKAFYAWSWFKKDVYK